jgi:hypothetical protein
MPSQVILIGHDHLKQHILGINKSYSSLNAHEIKKKEENALLLHT